MIENRCRFIRFAPVMLLLSFMSATRAQDRSPEAEGFTPIFNGRDLSGWQGLVGDPVSRAEMSDDERKREQRSADQRMRDHWTVRDGILLFDGNGNNLCTIKDYKNFVMLVDYKIKDEGDSGIYLRGTPQVQIWDPKSNPVGSGGLYNNKLSSSNPLVAADNPTGEWNSLKIELVGDKVTVWLNEQLVVDKTTFENYWAPEKPIYNSGPIELQSHSTPLEFRNIYVKELP